MVKVLIAEDTDSLRAELSQGLKAAGFDVIEAVDGKAGIDLGRSHNDIAVIVTDQNMPQCTGMEMIRALRATPGHQKTPVLFYTTEDRKAFAADAEVLQIKYWLVKPIKLEIVIKTIQKVIETQTRAA
jgi:two-component system chemotaxis response regulator CheY